MSNTAISTDNAKSDTFSTGRVLKLLESSIANNEAVPDQLAKEVALCCVRLMEIMNNCFQRSDEDPRAYYWGPNYMGKLFTWSADFARFLLCEEVSEHDAPAGDNASPGDKPRDRRTVLSEAIEGLREWSDDRGCRATWDSMLRKIHENDNLEDASVGLSS